MYFYTDCSLFVSLRRGSVSEAVMQFTYDDTLIAGSNTGRALNLLTSYTKYLNASTTDRPPLLPTRPHHRTRTRRLAARHPKLPTMPQAASSFAQYFITLGKLFTSMLTSYIKAVNCVMLLASPCPTSKARCSQILYSFSCGHSWSRNLHACWCNPM
jgi:hypothetical protein